MNILKIPNNVLYILDCLKEYEFEAYLVGGCVRDLLMGINPHDWDITTSATPTQIKKCFNGKAKFLEIGKKFGTIGILINNEVIEVTTYRKEGTYCDNRRPNNVFFTKNIIEDLSRRDFTINAIAYNPYIGFIDPFNGKQAIKEGIISCVGEANKRFLEDALRILRALRFSSTIGFNIDKEAKVAIFNNKDLILNLSSERIFSELCKLIIGKNVGKVLRDFAEIISTIIPEIKPMFGFNQMTPYHKYDVYEHTVKCIENIENNTILRLTMLFHDIAKPKCFSTDNKGVGHFYGHAKEGAIIADNILNRLNSSKEIKEKVVNLVKLHDVEIINEDKVIKRWMNKLGIDMFHNLIKVKIADNESKGIDTVERLKKFKSIEDKINEILKKQSCFSLKQLKINGNDLINIGISPSKKIGKLLDILLNAVIDGKCENEKSSLLDYIKLQGFLF